ncbi:MAG: ornithine carbamoyltransferase [Thermoplasmata archaeon]|nr:ornithine carbamoyltransferase [Thermoplasmata archaeon]
MSVHAKHDLLGLADLAGHLDALLARAAQMKEARRRADLSAVRPGRNIGMIFEKPSTRTRTSFEVAVNDLGGHALYLSPKDLQLGRGETIADTARVLSRYVDAIVYRAFRAEDMAELARWASIPVINALDNREHPCQIVADLLTLRERWSGSYSGHRLAWIGDGNNVCNSLMLGCAQVGLDFAGAIPEAYRPPAEVLENAHRYAKASGSKVELTTSPRAAVTGADAIYTDVWVSMGDEADEAQRMADFQGFQVNAKLLAAARPGALVMHDLPAHRGVEITDEVIDGPNSVVWDEAENRLHAQKAILEWALPAERGSKR